MAELSREQMEELMRLLESEETPKVKEEPQPMAISQKKQQDMIMAMEIAEPFTISMLGHEAQPEALTQFLLDGAAKLSETDSGLTVMETCLFLRLKDLISKETECKSIIKIYQTMIETIDTYVEQFMEGENKNVHFAVIGELVRSIGKDVGISGL